MGRRFSWQCHGTQKRSACRRCGSTLTIRSNSSLTPDRRETSFGNDICLTIRPLRPCFLTPSVVRDRAVIGKVNPTGFV